MVLVWNDLAGGDNDRAAVLVVFNAIFQVVAYALLGWFYLNALPTCSASTTRASGSASGRSRGPCSSSSASR